MYFTSTQNKETYHVLIPSTHETERNDSPCSGAVGARLSTDASTVKSLVGDTLALIVQNISTITAGLLISFTANWILAFIVLAVSPMVLMQGVVQMKFLRGFSADAKVSLTCSFANYIAGVIHCGNHELFLCRLCMKRQVKWQMMLLVA